MVNIITKNNSDKKNTFALALTGILYASLLLAGAFYEWTSCAVSLSLIVWIFLRLKAGKELSFRINLTLVSCVLISVAYAVTAFWAVDSGMAFVGFLKFLPVPLLLICIYSEKGAVLLIRRTLPLFAAATVVITSLLMQISAISQYFSVAGRLSGTFQYPNAFALFVLVAELIAFDLPVNKYVKAAVFAVLIFGLLYTGSRAVLVLAVIANIAVILCKIKASKKAAVISLAALALAAGIAAVLAFAGVSPFDRILHINFGASTFVGRLLYFKDALPVMIKNPFGYGYLGYFYSQTAFQTGIYSVKYVHNDILQFCLDIGWIPAAVFVAAIVRTLFAKGVGSITRIILSVMFLHCLFDFDLQFVAVFMLLAIFMNREYGKTVTISSGNLAFDVDSAALALLSLYFTVALGLSSFGQLKAANVMYRLNTDNQIKMLSSAEYDSDAEDIAGSIIGRNEFVYVAYSKLARVAYKQGDFGTVIKYKNLVFEYAPLVYEEYEEYMYMLINGVTLYNEAGNDVSSGICKKQILSTKEKYEANLSKISDLGMKIKDKPVTEFPDDIEDYIKKLSKEGV